MDEQIMMILESVQPELPALELEADLSVVHTTGEDSVVMAGDDHLLIQVNGQIFHVSSGSFFQVNSAVAGLMADHLVAHLPVTTSTTMLDVYCGVGFFSTFFADRVRRLIGIEAAPSACEDFTINLDEYENVELFEAPAEQVLPALEVAPEIVIVDPPRAGLERSVLDAIVTLAPDHLAYVSCDPATLARDASRLMAGGYRLKLVTPFDLFPQTYHIESISIFEKG
jgi:23S rRNA (uracil1939-C5)-methyltransferase